VRAREKGQGEGGGGCCANFNCKSDSKSRVFKHVHAKYKYNFLSKYCFLNQHVELENIIFAVAEPTMTSSLFCTHVQYIFLYLLY
jgi:hypothetical protein